MSAAADSVNLFDCFVVVTAESSSSSSGYSPSINFRFPPESDDDLNSIIQSLPQFCFPDLHILKPSTSYDSETFSFVLTASDGSKRFAYCRRLLPPGSSARMPECFCLISTLPCYSLFSQILNIVEERRTQSSISVFTFLKTVLVEP
eukprot:TRINITY_DN3049_c0_g1_i2.p1 TRINITY_DN3049_c0_g1~~TRINITY_DN3049_c0_g1_i2.p1  ORF type:complete len:147 (-),score=36.70 TRINITY_DN3049_c0_g1_i2:36-476(-)